MMKYSTMKYSAIKHSGNYLGLLIAATLLLICPSASVAQFPGQGQPTGVTVQLPSVRTFSINTVVSVPDGGSTYLGGVSRTGRTSISRGVPGLSSAPGINRLFRNRGIGQDISAGGASASVNIIIQDELEEQVMARARQMAAAREATDPNGSYALQAQANYLTEHMARSPGANQVRYNAYPSPYRHTSITSSHGLFEPVQVQQSDVYDREAVYRQTDYGVRAAGQFGNDPAGMAASNFAGDPSIYNQPATGQSLPLNNNPSRQAESPLPDTQRAPAASARTVPAVDSDELPPGFVPRSFNGTRFNRRN